MKDLSGKRVCITGAGSGLGKCLALDFARQGLKVALTDINETRAKETSKQIALEGGEAFAVRCDVASDKDFCYLKDRIQSEWNGLDILINNAGVSAGGSVEKTSIEDWKWIIEINLLGVVRGRKTFLPMLRQQEEAHIVNVASLAGIASVPNVVGYNVTKAAVIALSESLRTEVAISGIGVTVACPYFFASNILDSFRSPEADQKNIATRLIEQAKVSAEDVSTDIIAAIRNNRFLVFTHRFGRMLYFMKRISPEFYFRQLVKTVRKQSNPF